MKNIFLIRSICITLALFFLFSGAIYSQKKEEWKSSELILPDNPDYDPGWGSGTNDFKNLKILQSVDPSQSSEWLEKAGEEYREAVETMNRVNSEVENKREDYAAEKNPEDRYEWQKKAREDARERELARLLANARNTSIQHLIRGMKHLENIENPTIRESETYIDLKAGLYREYAKHQFAMKNYVQVADILNRYIQINDKFYNESEAHKLLSVAYERLESVAKKSRKTQLSYDLKEKKKRHLVTYAELHYGKESHEFQRIMDAVMKDY
ncbi:MAG: hypothetical protein JJT78_00360 [Leptospira sp.]|nr:hypothetical protein [Leptospira sp.]